MSSPRKPTGRDAADTHDYTRLWDRPGFLVRRLHQIHVAMFIEECGAGTITPVQFALLSALYTEGPLDQGRLGAEVGIDRTNVADVLSRLEGRGLLHREIDPDDRRRKQARLTARGRAFVERLEGSMTRAQERLIQPLDPEERAQFFALLNKLIAANNETGRAPLATRPSAADQSG